jgi:molecular chaperone GrpE
MPTLDDFRTLAQAYQDLQARHEQLGKELQEKNRELEIKSEALHRQSVDFKQMEAELMWNRAALQQAQEEREAGAGNENWPERYARLQAEIENLRKRWEQRFEVETREARHKILRDMLPLADHLDLALHHAQGSSDDRMREFIRSIEATRQAFGDTLRRYGVEPIAAMGEPFDPNLHEAVGEIEDAALAPGTVAQIVQTGYSEGENLLRPARVLVNRVATA